MKKLLHIIATPRGVDSRTLAVSGSFLESFKATHVGWTVEELYLQKLRLPELAVKEVDGKYVLLSGKELSGELRTAWNKIIFEIERFLSADCYLISTPMWNFSVPYFLKHYLDVILQPKYLFRYTPNGPEGLVKDRKMVIITSRGGDYSLPDYAKFDFLEPYLRFVFGFVGIKDISFINAQPMDMGPELQKSRLEEARILAKKIAGSL